jgi:hypothetical protein
VSKFHFSRSFAFGVIKAYKLADLRSPDDVNDVVKVLREAGPVPPKFSREDALKASAGYVVYLLAAFGFVDTPQGFVYWRELYDKKRELSRKDKAILLYWAALDARDKGECESRDEPVS